jgi:uroporphyrinogen-III synthase
MKTYRVIVTGDRDDWTPLERQGDSIQLHSLPVLRYERLPIPPDLLERWMSQKPVEWIVFTSPRAVRFWSETLLESGYTLPVETRVACMGERTSEVAEQDGYSVDFRPREPGTDGFLAGFEKANRGGSVLIPAAEGGRPKLKDRLKQVGFEVSWVPLYRTTARADLGDALSAEDLNATDAVVFTSPSSVDAFLDQFSLPDSVQVLAIGGFTGRHLEQRGFVRPRLLPNGDFSRIGEVLCSR